jgi:hypothetical protein
MTAARPHLVLAGRSDGDGDEAGIAPVRARPAGIDLRPPDEKGDEHARLRLLPVTLPAVNHALNCLLLASTSWIVWPGEWIAVTTAVGGSPNSARRQHRHGRDRPGWTPSSDRV